MQILCKHVKVYCLKLFSSQKKPNAYVAVDCTMQLVCHTKFYGENVRHKISDKKYVLLGFPDYNTTHKLRLLFDAISTSDLHDLSYTLSLPLYHRPLDLHLVTPNVSQTTDHLTYTLSLPVYHRHRPLVLYLVTLSVSQTTDHLSYTLSLPMCHRPQTTCLIPCHSQCITDHRPLVLYPVTPSVPQTQTTCLIPCHSQCITDILSYTLSHPVYHRHRPLVLHLVTASVSQTTPRQERRLASFRRRSLDVH